MIAELCPFKNVVDSAVSWKTRTVGYYSWLAFVLSKNNKKEGDYCLSVSRVAECFNVYS